jgi:hypothetical protein
MAMQAQWQLCWQFSTKSAAFQNSKTTFWNMVIYQHILESSMLFQEAPGKLAICSVMK